MLQISPRHTPLRGPAFIRQLARLAAVDVAAPALTPAEQLGLGLDWNQAVALSTALDAVATAASAPGHVQPGDACAQLRLQLAASIADDRAFLPTLAAEAPADFFVQRYQALQQAMEGGIARLRERLRAQLAGLGGEAARLAAVDALMERALARRERTALAHLPALLAGHFDRLRQAQASAGGPADADPEARLEASPDTGADDTAPAAVPCPAWRETFLADLRAMLLAELDVRLQPVLGLSAALSACQPGRYVQESA